MPSYWQRDYSHNQTTENLYESVIGRGSSLHNLLSAKIGIGQSGVGTEYRIDLEENQAAGDFWQFEDGSIITYL